MRASRALRRVRPHVWVKGLGVALLGATASSGTFAQTNWIGNNDTNWQNGANWSAGTPNSGTDASIGGGTLNAPTLTATANANTLSMITNTVTLNGQTLNATTVNLNGGTITGAGGGGTVNATTFNLINNGAFLTSAALNATTLNVSGGTFGGTSAATVTDANLTGGVYSGTSSISASGTITLNSASSFFNSSFQGTGNLAVNANAVLTNDNSYSGTTTIASGVQLQIGVGGTTGSLGTGEVITNGTNNIVINRTGTLTISAKVSGGSGIAFTSGGGTVILTGNNTFSGGTTVTNGGTLQVGAGGTLGSGTAFVGNASTLSFNSNGALAVANTINGTGTVTQQGSGTTVLTGSNNYSGATTITAGTLQIGDGGTTGSLGNGAGAVTNDSFLAFNRSNTLTVGNAIGGAGSIQQIGTGTTILTSTNNTYSGGTSVSAGILQVGTGSSIGTGTLGVNGGSFDLNGNNVTVAELSGTGGTITLGGGTLTLGTVSAGASAATVITGNGNLTFQGALSFGLVGNNDYVGTTTISSGSLVVGNGGTTGTLGTGNVVNNSNLSFSRSNTLTVSNDISGTGSVTQSVGGGTTILTGNNTYSGTTIITAGELQIGNGGTNGSLGTGAVVNNSILTFNRTDTITVANAISGSGGVKQNGTGTAILTGNNTYSNSTFVNAGTLQVGAGGTTGSLGTGNVINNSSLVFNRSDSITVGNAISGNGTVTQAGSGTTILSGSNIYSGGTTITAGTLQITSGNNLGTGNVVNNAALAVDTSGGAASLFQGISGTGSLTKLGGNGLTITGNNSYSGTTTNSGGILQVGQGALADSGTLGTGDVVNNGSLVVNRNTTLTISGNISGSGAGISMQGTGTLILTGTNTSAGGLLISFGSVQIGNGGTSGTLSGNGVTNNGNLTFNRSDSGLVVSDLIVASGTVTQAGTGTTTLTANNRYTGITTISAGTLQIGNGGTTGTLGDNGTTAGPVTDNAALVFNRSNALTVNNAIGGSGTVTQAGSGTTTFATANSYTGGTIVNAGTLQLGGSNFLAASGALTVNSGTFALNNFNQTVGALSGAGIVSLGSGTLTAGDSTSTTFSGAIGGTGSLVKQGSGILTLSGTNTYTGPTTVNAGSLAVNGSITSNVTVNAGGTLQGSGTVVGNVFVGGILAPGNSIGTLTIVGNYTQPGTYNVEVNAAGQSDRFNISGTATLTGGQVSVLAQNGRYQRSTSYTILSATGGLVGTYAGVSSNLAFLTPTLSYTSTDVLLTLLSSANSFQLGAQTANQRAVGAVLDRASPTATGDLATVLNAIYGLDTTQGPRALDLIGGQPYSLFGSIMVQGTQVFMDSFQMQAGRGAGAGSAAAPGAPAGSTYVALKPDNCDTACEADALWGVWGGGIGAAGTIAGDNFNAYGATYNLAGFVAGLDRRLSPNFRAGVAAGFNSARLYTQTLPGTGNSNSLQFALYGEYTDGPVYLDGMAGYAHVDNTLSRPIVISGLNARTAQGSTTANVFFGQLEAGYRIAIGPSATDHVTPFARLQGVTANQNGFTESGADSLNLTVAPQTTNSLRSVIGLQIGTGIDAGWSTKLDIVLRAGWSHDYADMSRPVTATFAGAPALGFTTYGWSAPRDGVVLGFALNALLAQRTSLYLRYDGDLAGANTNHAVSAGVRYVW